MTTASPRTKKTPPVLPMPKKPKPGSKGARSTMSTRARAILARTAAARRELDAAITAAGDVDIADAA